MQEPSTRLGKRGPGLGTCSSHAHLCPPLLLQEGVPGEFLRQRQHGEWGTWLQGGGEATHQSVSPCRGPCYPGLKGGFEALSPVVLLPSPPPHALKHRCLARTVELTGGDKWSPAWLLTPFPARAPRTRAGQGKGNEGRLGKRKEGLTFPIIYLHGVFLSLPNIQSKTLVSLQISLQERLGVLSEGSPQS